MRNTVFAVDHTPALIAVVDDEAPLRKAIGRALRLANYEATQYGCGEEFLGSLQERVPCCAVLDIHMPGLSGFDVESRLRAQGMHIPFVLMTGSDEPALVHQAKAIGAPLLRKPFPLKSLLEAVRSAVASRGATTT